MKTVFLVEDKVEEIRWMRELLYRLDPSMKVIVEQSYEGANANVVNKLERPDRAIVDARIFKAGPNIELDIEWGIRVAVNLVRVLGMETRHILIWTAYPERAEGALAKEELGGIDIIDKAAYPRSVEDRIRDFLNQP